MSTFTKFQLLSLFCLTTPLVAQGDEHDLRIAAKTGGTVWLLIEEKQENLIDMAGQQVETGGTTIRTLQVAIKDKDDKGNLVVEVTIARIHGSMTNPMMGDIEFDSAKKAEEAEEEDPSGMGFTPGALTKALTAFAGKSFIAKVDAFGKVGSLEGVAELLKNAKQGPGRGPAMGAPTEGQFKQYVESAFGALPTKPVVQGTSWEKADAEQSARGPMQTKLQLTLAKVDADSFEVTATGTIEQAAAPKVDDKAAEGEDPMRAMMKNMKVKNGKVSGTQRVSRQDGFIIESSNITSMDVDMPGPMGGEMSMSMKTTSKTKRTTAEAAMPKPAPKADKAEAGGKDGKEPGK